MSGCVYQCVCVCVFSWERKKRLTREGNDKTQKTNVKDHDDDDGIFHNLFVRACVRVLGVFCGAHDNIFRRWGKQGGQTNKQQQKGKYANHGTFRNSKLANFDDQSKNKTPPLKGTAEYLEK